MTGEDKLPEGVNECTNVCLLYYSCLTLPGFPIFPGLIPDQQEKEVIESEGLSEREQKKQLKMLMSEDKV